MHRQASPALSENEYDISKSLFQDEGSDSDSQAVDDAQRKDVLSNLKHHGISVEESDDDQDEAFIAAVQADSNRKNANPSGKTKSGAFQSMGLNPVLLKAVTRKGFSVPTPIQRKTIPVILDGQDVVGMARTGSGKTAAFVIPMIEKLKTHSVKVGARAIVLSPSRELALQTLKVIKEFGKGTDLRTCLLVGGDSLEEQFSSMASNPDVIIATPGRFEHLKVEMRLDLSSVKYVVFDEADRLFEMGFAAQLAEIMHSLPPNRQTLLFSATLPKSLVEFARAGLQEPKLVRLDAESKIAPGLESAFFTVKRQEKEGALLHVLQDVIKMPIGQTEAASKAKEQTSTSNSKKRKRDAQSAGTRDTPSEHSTVVFAATKHHVEYLANLLKLLGYATSYVYGSLDQTARKIQVEDFRKGLTNILVVTDVAARGLDIPILANVINYDFPSQPKIFVHRVGRTARASKTGWAYSLVTVQDMPYLLDLQLFLSRKLILGRADKDGEMFKNDVVVGGLVRDKLERCCEEVTKLLDDDSDLALLRDVAGKGEKQYLRTRNAASAESVKRARGLAQSENSKGANMLFANDKDGGQEQARLDMLARVSGFRPQETVFEIGRRGTASEAADIMRKRRSKVQPKHRLQAEKEKEEAQAEISAVPAIEDDSDDELVLTAPQADVDMDDASDSELELIFTGPDTKPPKSKSGGAWQDSEHFMSYTPSTLNLAEDRGYGVNSGGTDSQSNFLTAAKDVSMDLTNDDDKSLGVAKAKGLRWDKKSKKYVQKQNDEDGSKGAKMILGESGQKIAASFRSGRFDAWRKAHKMERLPRVGEEEKALPASYRGGEKRFKHKAERAPKEADKYRDDYYKKKKLEAAKENRVGKFAEGKGKSEIRGVEDVRKLRGVQSKRKEKNARPSKRKF